MVWGGFVCCSATKKEKGILTIWVIFCSLEFEVQMTAIFIVNLIIGGRVMSRKKSKYRAKSEERARAGGGRPDVVFTRKQACPQGCRCVTCLIDKGNAEQQAAITRARGW